MTRSWVGTEYSGAGNVRFPLTDEGYEEWWGYLRYEPADDDPPLDSSEFDEPLTVEPDERVQLQPNLGWPGRKLRLEVIHSRRHGRGFEALVREYFEADD